MNASICACDCDCVTYPSFFGRMGIQKMSDALTLSPQEVLSIMYSNSMSFFRYYAGQISWERLVEVTQVCKKFFPISLVFWHKQTIFSTYYGILVFSNLAQTLRKINYHFKIFMKNKLFVLHSTFKKVFLKLQHSH